MSVSKYAPTILSFTVTGVPGLFLLHLRQVSMPKEYHLVNTLVYLQGTGAEVFPNGMWKCSVWHYCGICQRPYAGKQTGSGASVRDA
jgi:hypothetical protein